MSKSKFSVGLVWFGMVWSSFYDDLTPQRCRYQHVRGYFGIFFHCPSIVKVKSAVQLYKSADIKVKSLFFFDPVHGFQLLRTHLGVVFHGLSIGKV